MWMHGPAPSVWIRRDFLLESGLSTRSQAADVSVDDKDDAKENLQKLTDELAGEKNSERISR